VYIDNDKAISGFDDRKMPALDPYLGINNEENGKQMPSLIISKPNIAGL
jgi:hypothetical protein